MIEIEEVWARIDRFIEPLPAEDITLEQASGRVLREDVRAEVDQPPFDQSAMDGYAVGSDPGGSRLPVTGCVAAGDAPGRGVQPRQAVRILTGAPVPEGTYAVVAQEDCVVEGDAVCTAAHVPAGANVRLRGSAMRSGDVVIRSGWRVLPGASGLLASSGATRLRVSRRPRAVHLVTGDEIVAARMTPARGQVRDANSPLIESLLREDGIQPERHYCPDDAARLHAAVAGWDVDLLLISGSSGHGDRDHASRTLAALGFTLHCSAVNSRPGKPLIFATQRNRIAFGLPGNPLAHFVCYQAFVRRALARLEGRTPPRLCPARLVEGTTASGQGRRLWMPARLGVEPEGWVARALRWEHSGDLRPLASANGLILCAGSDLPEVGEKVAVLPAFDVMEQV